MATLTKGHEHPITVKPTDEAILAPDTGDLIIRSFCEPCQRTVQVAMHVDEFLTVNA